MKTCKTCEFRNENGIWDGPDGRPQAMWMCKHEECVDPVVGDPIPCALARRDGLFCGPTGRYYKEAKAKPPDNNKVIEISK